MNECCWPSWREVVVCFEVLVLFLAWHIDRGNRRMREQRLGRKQAAPKPPTAANAHLQPDQGPLHPVENRGARFKRELQAQWRRLTSSSIAPQPGIWGSLNAALQRSLLSYFAPLRIVVWMVGWWWRAAGAGWSSHCRRGESSGEPPEEM